MGSVFVKKVHVYEGVNLEDEFSSTITMHDIESNNGVPAIAFQTPSRHDVLSKKVRRSRATLGSHGK